MEIELTYSRLSRRTVQVDGPKRRRHACTRSMDFARQNRVGDVLKGFAFIPGDVLAETGLVAV